MQGMEHSKTSQCTTGHYKELSRVPPLQELWDSFSHDLGRGFLSSQLRCRTTLQNTLQTCVMNIHSLEVWKCILSTENVLASSRASIAF